MPDLEKFFLIWNYQIAGHLGFPVYPPQVDSVPMSLCWPKSLLQITKIPPEICYHPIKNHCLSHEMSLSDSSPAVLVSPPHSDAGVTTGAELRPVVQWTAEVAFLGQDPAAVCGTAHRVSSALSTNWNVSQGEGEGEVSITYPTRGYVLTPKLLPWT